MYGQVDMNGADALQLMDSCAAIRYNDGLGACGDQFSGDIDASLLRPSRAEFGYNLHDHRLRLKCRHGGISIL